MKPDDDWMLPTRCGNFELPPADMYDPVIELYKQDVDRTLLRENLKLTDAQRAAKMESFMQMADELREAGRRWRGESHGM